MRIKRAHHAADCFFHELVVVDLIHVFALDALVDFGEEARLFPGKSAGGRRGLRRIALPACHRIACQGRG